MTTFHKIAYPHIYIGKNTVRFIAKKRAMYYVWILKLQAIHILIVLIIYFECNKIYNLAKFLKMFKKKTNHANFSGVRSK